MLFLYSNPLLRVSFVAIRNRTRSRLRQRAALHAFDNVAPTTGAPISFENIDLSASIEVGLFNDSVEIVESFGNVTNCSYFPSQNLEQKFWLLAVLMPIICLFGIVGNSMAIMVLLQRRLRGPNNYYLTALAVCDIGMLITALMLYTVEVAYDYFSSLFLYELWISYLREMFFLSHTFQVAEIYMTMAATVERFITIVFLSPDLKSVHPWCDNMKTFIYILIVYIFAIMFSLTRYLEIEVIIKSHCEGFARYEPTLSAFAQNPTYSLVYGVWITHLLIVFLPFCVLLILNSYASYRFAIYERRLKRHGSIYVSSRNRRSRKAMLHNSIQRSIASSQRKKIRAQRREANLLLLIVVAVFLVCNSPGFLLTLVEHVDKQFLAENSAFYSLSRDIVNILTILSASSNFVIYILFGAEFRKGLTHLCLFMWPCCRGRFRRSVMHADGRSNGTNSFLKSVLQNHATTVGSPVHCTTDILLPRLSNGNNGITNITNSDSTESFLTGMPREFYDFNQLKKLGLPIPSL